MEARWNDVGQRDWERLTRGRPVAMQQHWAYGAACEALGSRVLRAELSGSGKTVALAQLVYRRLFGFLHIAVCTRGPVWLGAADADARAEAIATLRRSLPLPWTRGLFVTPDAPADEADLMRAAGMTRVMTPYSTAIIDLGRDDASLRAAMHGKWRNRLVAAERQRLEIVRADATPDRYAWLLAEEARQQRRQRYAALPPALVQAWQRAGGRVRVWAARHAGRRVAAMLFLVHGRRATYHVGWSCDEGKRLSAHNAVLWTAMRSLRDGGVGELDMGGIDTDRLPGIARFKLGAGAAPATLCGTWFGR